MNSESRVNQRLNSEIKINSEITYTAISNRFGIIGYLVIDKLINGSSFGGVRIVPDISLVELQSVARSMTYKNAFIDNKTGGAKAAVIIKKENEPYRPDILFEFGKCISPFVKSRMFLPVMDMGITPEELQIIFNGTGYRCDISSWKHSSHEYTAYSCFYSTLVALEKRRIPVKDATFSVQGFGSVGSAYAELMYHAGAKLTALSNKHYGIIDDNGFDVYKLISERSIKGDDFILSMSDRKTSHDSILEKDVTVLLPASNALVINNKNYKKIKADIIICAANAPVSHETERLLFQDGKIVITDFIANCGGSLGSIMDNYIPKEMILQIISTSYKQKVEEILNQSQDSNIPFVDIITEQLAEKIDGANNDKNKSFLGSSAIIGHILSYSIINRMTRDYMSKKYMSRYERIFGDKIKKNYKTYC